MTLWDTFMNSTQPAWVRWKIFSRSRKLLCSDYGSLKNEEIEFDDLEVYKAEIKYDRDGIKYVRVVVEAK